MILTDLNPSGGIGSNSLLVELGPFRFLIDAGLHPKIVGRAAVPDFSRIGDAPLDFVLLTHCHLDHLGALPVVLRNHPEALVLMSPPSVILAERMLHNSCNVMLRQREEENLPEYPLYTHSEVDRQARRFLPVHFGQTRTLHKGGESIAITLHLAGHVPGAAGVLIEHRHRKVFFTGDVLFEPQLIVPGADFPTGPFDTVVLETTRGATGRATGNTRTSESARLIETIRHVIEGGGSVLLPVFALGRMQEMFTLLHQARNEGRLPAFPIYGAGLGLDLAGYLDRLSRRHHQIRFKHRILKELRLRPLPRKLVPGRPPREPGLYVLSSGMMVENTPSYGLAACLAGHHHQAICFVGYCDPDTPGGKLLATRHGEVFVFDGLAYQTPVQARIERFELTGHADRDELVAFARGASPRAVVLTHGDPPARAWFAQTLAADGTIPTIIDPRPLTPVEV
ncbi:MAG: MBL fold metallo-hydrolase [Puniceicoccaceae bacterium]|nr:MAG: MBL fold metallo-hydrolase [Puniceicoccaceae bacterium]